MPREASRYTTPITKSIMHDRPDGTTYYSGLYHNMIYEGDAKKIPPYNIPIPNGKGKITYRNGDIYEGEFVDGKRFGFGKITTTQDGVVKIFEGEWENDSFKPKPASSIK